VVSLEPTLSQLFSEFGLRDRNSEESFALGHLEDHIGKCCIFISHHSVEIARAFLPAKRIGFLSDNKIRRIYLSATLTSEVDFCRAFGKKPSYKVEPESDAGIGERLIVLSDRESVLDKGAKGVTDARIASVVAAQHKLLICTPNYGAAAKYENLATAPSVKEFSVKLDDFRKRTNLGVDLPHATCRVMLTDGLPTGFSLHEVYLYDYLEMRASFAAKLANRITQMFGRTNRGRNDYSVIFVTDRKFANWLSTPTNIALLPELLDRL
jgi:Rad3-related DNA helicase